MTVNKGFAKSDVSHFKSCVSPHLFPHTIQNACSTRFLLKSPVSRAESVRLARIVTFTIQIRLHLGFWFSNFDQFGFLGFQVSVNLSCFILVFEFDENLWVSILPLSSWVLQSYSVHLRGGLQSSKFVLNLDFLRKSSHKIK